MGPALASSGTKGFLAVGVLAPSLLGIAVLSLGVSDYIGLAIPGLQPIPTALVVIAGSTLLGVLNIRTNAVVTGAFLAVEILANAKQSYALADTSKLGKVAPHRVCALDELTAVVTDERPPRSVAGPIRGPEVRDAAWRAGGH